MQKVNGISESSPPPSESDSLISDVLREVLARVIAQAQDTWQRERKVIEAEAARIIAELRAEVSELRGEVTRLVADRLATVRDGARGPQGAPGLQRQAGPAWS
jgi:hypothetical protein